MSTVSTQLGVSYSNEMGFASIRSAEDSHKILLTSDILFSFVSFLFTKNSVFFLPYVSLTFEFLIYSPCLYLNTRTIYQPNIFS